MKPLFPRRQGLHDGRIWKMNESPHYLLVQRVLNKKNINSVAIMHCIRIDYTKQAQLIHHLRVHYLCFWSRCASPCKLDRDSGYEYSNLRL